MEIMKCEAGCEAKEGLQVAMSTRQEATTRGRESRQGEGAPRPVRPEAWCCSSLGCTDAMK